MLWWRPSTAAAAAYVVICLGKVPSNQAAETRAATRKCDLYLCSLASVSCLESVSMDRDQEDVIHNSRRSAGGSLWSGLKQIFHNKSPGQPPPPEATSNSRPRRLEHSSFSYSCLGNSNSRNVEDEMYGDTGSGMASQSSLSRNISYSHESVFQMDPPNNIPVSKLFPHKNIN